MANILNSLSKVSRGDVVMSVRDIKKTFVEGGQPLHILRGGGFDLHRGESWPWSARPAVASPHCCNV